MKIKKHMQSGLWVREDGAVCMPPSKGHKKYRWTYGSKNNSTKYMIIMCKRIRYRVHRLIYEAFKEPIKNGFVIDHINRIRFDNRIENLRCVTKNQNEANKQCVEDSIRKYGIRSCDDINAYTRAYRKINHDKQKERIRNNNEKFRECRYAQGLTRRKCDDGVWRWVKRKRNMNKSLAIKLKDKEYK